MSEHPRPRPPGALCWGTWRLLWYLGRALFGAWLRLRLERPPATATTGPMVVAANHCSYLDPPLLALALRRPLVFLVTEQVYDRWYVRPFLALLGCIPVRAGRRNLETMQRALAALRAGWPVGIFPEGGISDDGRLREGELGVASLLLKGRVPLLPAAVVGTRESLPRGRRIPRRGPVQVTFGTPIQADELAAGRSPHEARRSVRDRVMAEIGDLLPGQMRPTPQEGRGPESR